MYFQLQMPYDASIDINHIEDLKGYYRDEDEYVDTLVEDYNRYDKGILCNAIYTGDYSVTDYRNERKINAIEKLAYSTVNVRLEAPNTNFPETVDSIVERFATQQPFLIEFVKLSQSVDGQFEEEMKQWWKDTRAVLEVGKKLGGAWIDKNIPKKDMKVTFLNKSNQRVTFILEGTEIETRNSSTDYVLFVNKMTLER